MNQFFQHFPPELSSKTAFKMIRQKMEEALKKYKDDDPEYLHCLHKLKDMLTIYLQEVSE